MTTPQPWTRQELRKLAEEAETLADWITVRDFANQTYGDSKAVKVEIDTDGSYDDEGGTEYHIVSIVAHDKDGKELQPDYTLPFFQTEFWKDGSQSVDEYQDEDEEDDKFLNILRELYGDDDERAGYIFFEDLPANDKTYDLTVVPSSALLPAAAS